MAWQSEKNQPMSPSVAGVAHDIQPVDRGCAVQSRSTPSPRHLLRVSKT